MTGEDASLVVEAHIRWLENEGDRATIAEALKTLFFYMGALSSRQLTIPADHEEDAKHALGIAKIHMLWNTCRKPCEFCWFIQEVARLTAIVNVKQAALDKHRVQLAALLTGAIAQKSAIEHLLQGDVN